MPWSREAARQTFRYDPLGSRSIRILRLFPTGRTSRRLKGSITIASLDDEALSYEALSYMWGDPEPVDAIYVDGKRLPIAANLARALYHIRPAQEVLHIWIDALCINQKDLRERSEQVHLMRHIYRKARPVRIWIYEPSIDPSSSAVKALQSFEERNDSAIDMMGVDPHFWDPVVPIFANDYWRRVWIQQEVVNASRIQLHCMNVVVSYESLLKFQRVCKLRMADALDSPGIFTSWIRQMNELSPCVLAPASNIAFFHRFKKIEDHTTDLLQLLEDCFGLAVGDERDRVYAIMHLADDYDDGDIDVDYTKPTTHVMISAIEHHINKHKSLKFLCEKHLEDTECLLEPAKDDNTPPTWLPQYWSLEPNRGNIAAEYVPTIRADCTPNAISTDKRRLRIEGARIGKVQTCFSGPADLHHTTLHRFWISPIGMLLQDYCTCTHCQSLPEDLYSILTAETEPERTPSYDNVLSGLHTLYHLASIHGEIEIGLHGEYVMNTLTNVDHGTAHGISSILECLDSRMILLTEEQHFALMPCCAVKTGDELWLALGCPMPIVLRPEGEYYLHVGAICLPALYQCRAIKSLNHGEVNSDGNSWGERCMETIELI